MANFRIVKRVTQVALDLLPRQLRARLADRRAAVALIVAIAAPLLIGVTALGTDTAYWYGSQEAVQTAVDAAAFSAAHFATANTPAAVIEAVAVQAANQAANNQFPGTSQCAINPNACEFNSQNLTASVIPDSTYTAAPGQPGCYKKGKGNGGGEIKCPPSPPGPGGDDSGSGATSSATATASSSSASVSVTATIPQPTFFIGALMNMNPNLQQQAASITQTNYIPPANDSCSTPTGITYVMPGTNNYGLGSGHGGGVDYSACGSVTSQFTPPPLLPAQSGYLKQSAFYLNDNGGQVPTTPSGIPTQAPGCNSLYDSSQPSTAQGGPNTATSDGMTVYFGPATATSNGPGNGKGPGKGPKQDTTYSFSPIIVQPGSSFCDTSNNCTIPAGAYCGGIQINPGVTVNFVAANGSSNFLILDGNLVISSDGVTYGPQNDQSAAFYFGGSLVGSLVQNTLTAVYPGEIQNGTLVYTTTTTSVLQNTGGINTIDQICPGGVAPLSYTSNFTPICPVIDQSTTGGQTNTNISSTQTVNGQVAQGYRGNVGSAPLQQVDTYVTKVTFKNGVPIYTQASETTTSSVWNGSAFVQASQGGVVTLSIASAIGNNSNAAPDAASNDCTASSSDNLFSSQTPGNAGYSFSGSNGQGYTQQSDTIAVCGKGPQLVANPTGAEVVASGTLTTHVYLTQ